MRILNKFDESSYLQSGISYFEQTDPAPDVCTRIYDWVSDKVFNYLFASSENIQIQLSSIAENALAGIGLGPIPPQLL